LGALPVGLSPATWWGKNKLQVTDKGDLTVGFRYKEHEIISVDGILKVLLIIAIANMTTVTKSMGPAPSAFVVVPLVGAFFVDLSNALIINLLLYWFG
jgi:sodium--glutamate symport carrier gltS